MKKFVYSLVLLVGLTAVTSSAFAADSLRTRADQAVGQGYDKVVLHVVGGDIPANTSVKGTKYNSKFVPLRDVFGASADAIKWDNKRKIATVENDGKKLVLNFSDEDLYAKEGEVIVPRTWITMQNGNTMIDVYVIAYILNRYGDSFKDTEREQWNKRLDFLGIEYAESLQGIRNDRMNIYVTLPDKK
ncbi:stalk domain-containing protein [Saccharibacillus deserti]|uniref:stalk domain-containing protein n=1 Tax=Saccharibacillus deserti TaxID=1634444 RepID=UPI001557E533|nr:stalk domain-containing protein [Saccharibacillus deserti]